MTTDNADSGDPPGLTGPRHGQRRRHRYAKGRAYLLAAASFACGGVSAVLGVMAYRSRQPGNLRDWASWLALLSLGTLCLLLPLAGLDVRRRRKELGWLLVAMVVAAAILAFVGTATTCTSSCGWCGRTAA